MAYQEHSINALDELLPIIFGFANDQGWTVTMDGPSPVISYAGADSPIAYKLEATAVTLRWAPQANMMDRGATMHSPILARDSAPSEPFVPSPTKAFVIGSMTPEPYIAIVVEFGFNLMRHLYFGYMEKVGDYTGGEVVSAVNGYNSYRVSGAIPFTELSSWGCKYLFSGAGSADLVKIESGGVMVNHPDNPYPWRYFWNDRPSYDDYHESFYSDSALGGFRDAINDGYVARGKSSVANANPLVPIELLVSRRVTDDVMFKPIGRPAGVRMLNLDGLETYSQMTLGTDTWHCFPAIAKKNFTDAPRAVANNSGGWRKEQTSYHLGYAYKE